MLPAWLRAYRSSTVPVARRPGQSAAFPDYRRSGCRARVMNARLGFTLRCSAQAGSTDALVTGGASTMGPGNEHRLDKPGGWTARIYWAFIIQPRPLLPIACGIL